MAVAPRVAWIGLGQMGASMSANIVRNGPRTFSAPLLLYNRTTARAEKVSKSLPEGKTRVVHSVEEAVEQADIIFTIVSNDAATEETVSKATKASSGLKGKLYIDCSTVAPDTTERIAKQILDAGGAFLAMPVFGAVAMAEAAQLVCVPCGPKQCVDKVRPFLDGVMGRSIIDLSDQTYGMALRLKIIGNSFVLNMAEALAEGHVLAEKCGLGTKNLHQFVTAFFPGPYVGYSERMISGDYVREEPPFHVDLARKDARHVMELGQTYGVRLRNAETVDGQLEKLQKHAQQTRVTGDLAQIYGLARTEAGLDFKA